MGSLYQININELAEIIGDAEYDGGSVQPPAGYTGYAVVDSGSNIRSAPTSDLQLFYVYEYESNQGPLAFTAAQAATLVSAVEYFKHSVSFSAPSGDAVGVSDNLQNLATLTADDVTELNSLGLSITAVDSAGDIENVPLGELETLGHGVTFEATDTSVELSAALAMVFGEENDTVSAPSGDTVTVDENAAYISALTPTELDAIGSSGVTAIVATNVDQVSVYNYLTNLFGTETSAPAPYTSYGISDSAADIESLTPEQIAAMPAADVYSVTAGDMSLILNAPQAVAFENAHIILSVPQNDTIEVVDTAATLEALTPTEMSGLGQLGIGSIAADDTLPVFSLAQMSALDTVGTTYTGQAYSGVAVVPPPNNAGQNDGTITIEGPNGSNGLTFDITWDSSVASAPAEFKTDVEEAFQFYADEFDNPITLYYDVGFGEVDGTAMERGANGESSDNYEPAGTWSYSQLLTALQNDAQSAAQKMAVQSLPSTDPTGGANLIVRDSEALALGLPGAPVDSASSPDAEIGLTDGPPIGPSTDPNQGPSNTSEIDLISTAEHEIAEGMGRVSEVNTAATAYSPIDLFRFSGKNDDRALTSTANPSYFSIDDGATRLSEWNNYSAGNNGDDLGDWAEYANPYEVDNPPNPSSSTPAGYTYDSYDAGSPGGTLNPITAPDLTLMNVLGYNLASPSETLPLPSQAIEITVASLLEDLVVNQINSSDGAAPAGDYYALVDTAFAIESITPAEFTGAIGLGLAYIYVTDPPNYLTSPTLTLTAAQATALAVPVQGNSPVTITPAANSTVTITDTAADIKGMSAQTMSVLYSMGVREISATDTAVFLSADQAEALGGIPVYAAPTWSVIVEDTAAVIEGLNSIDLSIFDADLVSAVESTTGSVVLTVSEAIAFANAGLPIVVPPPFTVTVDATAAAIAGLTAAELTDFDSDQVSAVVSTTGSVVLSINEALAYANADLPITVPFGDTVTVADTASDIEDQLVSQSEVDQLSSIGVSAIAATDASLQLSYGLVIELEQDDITVSAPQGDSVTLGGISNNIEGLTPSEILGLPQIAITAISSGTNIPLAFSVDQALALESADVYVNTAPSPADVPYVADTTAKIASLTPDQILALRSIGLTGRINATGASLDLTVAQAQALVTNDMGVYVLGGGIEIIDYASNIEAAMATFATDVEADQPFLFERLGTYSLAATDASIVLTTAEAQTMVEEAQFHFYVPAGDTVTVAGSAYDIESLIGLETVQLGSIATAGIGALVATDTSVQLSVADALKLEGLSIIVDAPSGDTVTIADTAADIEALTLTEIAGLPAVGVTAIAATDASVQLTVAQAVALEQAGIAVTAPSGDTVTISDTAVDIENMSKYQIAGLPAIGVSGVTATDASVVLDVEQALAFEEVSIPITAPPGDSVSVSDSEQQVDTLTPAEVAALPSIGISDIEVSSLTGLAPVVTIAGGITLTVDGPISAGQTIDFAPSGGTLSAADYLGMQGTISGFAPTDTIDLTDVDYQAGNVPFLTGNNELVFSEYGYPYSINLDPNQYFGDATFALNPDSGNGTDINVTEAPISSYLAISDGQTAYGLPIANGGTVEVQSGGALVGATLSSGATLNVDSGASASNVTVQDGGYEYLAPGATATDTILTDPGAQFVDVNATATDTQVNGGQQTVYGSAVDTLVENGGEQDVESGGTATDTQIETGGNQYVFGTNSDAEITDGGTQTIGYGGSDSDSTVGNSGYQYVDPYATASGTLITDGGYQWDYGSVIDAVVASAQGNDGAQFVEQGGSTTGTTIERGGVETVLAGGTASDTAIDGGALLDIQAEGVAEGDIDFAELRGTLQLDSTSLPVDPALAIGADIFGFSLTDRIELTGVPYDSNGQTNLLVGNELQITENGATYALQFDPTEDFSGEYFQLSPNELLGGTNVTKALMTPYTWTGDAGTSDLSDPDNWDALIGLAGLPGPQNMATFPTGGTIAGTLDAGVISIAGPVTYTNGAFSDVGDLLIDLPTGSTNGLILQSGVTGTVSGTVIVGQVGDAALAIEGSIESQAGNIGGDAGSNGSVVLDDNGASWTVANDLVVGDAGSGTLAISDGSLSALVEFVGLDGTGSVTQSGGTNTVGPAGTTTFVSDRAAGDTISVPAGTLFIGGGEDGPGTGSYTLAGGSLTVAAIDVGSGGSFAFDGGAANFSTFELDNGGAVTASGNEVIGTSTSSDSTFIQLGGSNTIGSTADPAALVLGGVAGTTATYNLEGGTRPRQISRSARAAPATSPSAAAPRRQQTRRSASPVRAR